MAPTEFRKIAEGGVHVILPNNIWITHQRKVFTHSCMFPRKSPTLVADIGDQLDGVVIKTV
jgi:hypothetical protein